ncbi:MAG: hypothetical protein R6V85_03840 [Polyangia bacterium]
MPSSFTRAAAVAVSLVAVAGCGGGFALGEPWEPGEARFFDDGVDLMKQPSKLSGQWAYDQQQELDGRVTLADLIAVVEIGSVQTTTDLEGREAKRIEIEIVEKLYGEKPSDTLSLESNRESVGYPLVLRHERHLRGEFIAFLRFFEGEDGQRAQRFHLSPASAEMRKLVREKVEERIEAEQTAANRPI